jgi:hypothetical protein
MDITSFKITVTLLIFSYDLKFLKRFRKFSNTKKGIVECGRTDRRWTIKLKLTVVYFADQLS